MKIYFVRHGQTQANLDKTYNGQIDEVLIPEGVAELEELKANYEGLEFDHIYSSPLTRCQQTFDILFPDQEINDIDERLIEINFGDWSGRTYESVLTELAQQGYKLSDFVNPPNGETYEQLFARTTDFLEEIKGKHQEDENILVMAHGLVISAIMKQHFFPDEVMYHLAPDNGRGYVIEFKDGEYNIEKL